MNFLCTYIYKHSRMARKEKQKHEKILKIIKKKISLTRLQYTASILEDIAFEQNKTLIEINKIITAELNKN